jgi:hypothetical protein
LATPQTPTVAAPPSTTAIAQQVLASMAALSGVLTDYNVGSQIRTQTESLGSVGEIQGISSVALALQVIAYSAMSLFGITPNAAVPATGTVTFTTALANPPPATQNVSIPLGTLVQTIGGIQFATTQTAVLLQGAPSINVPIQAVQGGILGNVPGGAIVQIITGLSYPLVVFNSAPTVGGLNAETPSQAMTRLAAKISSLVGGSPVSVANAAYGVMATGSNEAVLYSTCYEPWIAAASGSSGATQAGFSVYIDDGAGTASSGLISAVYTKLNGNLLADIPAYRPAGVPYHIYAVTPVFANVSVSGNLVSYANKASVVSNITTAVSGYFTLPFGIPASIGAITAVVSNAALGLLTAIDIGLFYASDLSQTLTPAVTGQAYQRVLLNTLTVNLTQ